MWSQKSIGYLNLLVAMEYKANRWKNTPTIFLTAWKEACDKDLDLGRVHKHIVNK